jgi:hypothetical protein
MALVRAFTADADRKAVTRMKEMATSWILELRQRLRTPPARLIAPEQPAVVGLVPLYVEQGELWVQLLEREAGSQLGREGIALAAAPLATGEDPWRGVVQASAELDLEASTLLQIGLLDPAPSPSGLAVVPCVVAIPAREEGAAGFGLPVTAIASPRLVEERRLVREGRLAVVKVVHVGKHRLWGPTAVVLELLLRRLGLS